MSMEENMRWLTHDKIQHGGWHLVWQILSWSILLGTLEAALNELNVVDGGCLKGRHPKLNSHC